MKESFNNIFSTAKPWPSNIRLNILIWYFINFYKFPKESKYFFSPNPFYGKLECVQRNLRTIFIHTYKEKKLKLFTNELINCNPAQSWFLWNCFAMYWNDRSVMSVVSVYGLHLAKYRITKNHSILLKKKICYVCFIYSIKHVGLNMYNLIKDISPGCFLKGWQRFRLVGQMQDGILEVHDRKVQGSFSKTHFFKEVLECQRVWVLHCQGAL